MGTVTRKTRGRNHEALSAGQGESVQWEQDTADDSVDINGGTIDNTTIGGTTPAAGTFTTLTGTTVDGIIGSVTPAAGTFTTLTGTTVDGIIGSVTPASAVVTTLNATGAVTFGSTLDTDGNITTVGLNLISFEDSTVYFEGEAIFN